MDKIPSMIGTLGTAIIAKLPGVINTVLPRIAESAVQLLTVLTDTLTENSEQLAEAAVSIVGTLVSAVIKLLPRIIKLGGNLLLSLIQGIEAQYPGLSAVVEAIIAIFAAIQIGSTIQKIVTGFDEAKLALALFSKQANGVNLTQAALNKTLTLGQTVVGLLTGKITLAQLAEAGLAKAQTALNAVMAANPVGLVVAAIVALGVGIYSACKAYDRYIEKNNALVIKTREMAEASQETKEKVSELSDTLQGLSDNAATSIESAEAETYANKALADELYNLAG